MIESVAEIFVRLGGRLSRLTEADDVVVRACAANGWFMPAEVVRALHAVADDMLGRQMLMQWMRRYPQLPAGTQRNVLVVMAGNIPAVGFFDLLCVVMSGCRCLVKPSSKDRVLMEYIVSQLLDICPQLPLEMYDNQRVDAVIATGSDNACRYFRAMYGGIPSLLRGSRSSVAVLSEADCCSGTAAAALADDIFAYSGLGCRNVSLVFVPRGCRLPLAEPAVLNPKYMNNYRRERAVAAMRGEEFVDTGFAVVTPGYEFPPELSRITCAEYDSTSQVTDWLDRHDDEIQCVVTDWLDHPRRAGLGRAQHPSLTDYPDGRDVMAFLASIS